MMEQPFGSSKVITERISESDFSTYFVGFDIDDTGNTGYRWKDFINILQKVIPEFAFGHHMDITTTDATEKLSDAAKSIYKIPEFKEVKDLYEKGIYIRDDDPKKEHLRRGEFGELILHLILRDFHNTIPLISKIYFKDSYNHTVHGFDAVHIQPDKKTLWLGESKLYVNGTNGIKSLINDIKNHIKSDYLQDEFTIVSKKVKLLNEVDIPNKKYWIDLLNSKTKLSDVLGSVTIPLLCTYTSENFSIFKEESAAFFKEYEREVRTLKRYFDEQNDHPLKTRLNIILILFPVKCKNELVKKMHKKLSRLQEIEDDDS